MDKLANRCGSVSHGSILYPFGMRGGYDSMMDNGCNIEDGMMYKITPCIADDDILAEDLKEGDIDYAMLMWVDFTNSRKMDNVRLKDRKL